MEKLYKDFIAALGEYLGKFDSLRQHILAGNKDDAIEMANALLVVAKELDTLDGHLESAGLPLPTTISPYDGWYVETIQELRGDGMLVNHQCVAWLFQPEELGE